MILDVLHAPHPILSTVSEPVEAPTKQHDLAHSMVETMRSTKPQGIGLAAPQVGHLLRLVVLDLTVVDDALGPLTEQGPTVLINPVIVEHSEGDVPSNESCLSVPRVGATVRRFETIVVEAQRLSGEKGRFSASGIEAIIVQHEIDHLDGKTIYDVFSRQQRRRYERELSRLRRVG